jgi:hypothetical protein
MGQPVESYSYTLKSEDFDNRTGETIHVQEFHLAGEQPVRLPSLSISRLCVGAEVLPSYLISDDPGIHYAEPVSRIPQSEVYEILTRRKIHPQVAEAITETMKAGWVISFPGAILENRPYLSVVKRADVFTTNSDCHIKLTGSYLRVCP